MILCCGEALIDMLPRQSTLGENCYAPYAGGAIFNTAIALGRLGIPTAFFTGLSDDMLGDVLRETLRASHVDDSPCAVSSRPTTVAFVKLVNGETAVVMRRGIKPAEPVVACVLNRNDEPIAEPRLRDTSRPDLAIQSTLSGTSVRVNLNTDLMIRLIPRQV